MYKESFRDLVRAMAADEEALEVIEDRMYNLAEYVHAVYSMEVQLQTLRFRLEGEAYRDAVTNLDRRRRIAHEAAISGCAVLCRMADSVGVARMYQGDLTDRYAIADFCVALVDELYRGRSKCSLSELLD